jgi:hypothetical protein
MQKHDSKSVPSLAIPLHTMFRNAIVAAAFRRADRDFGSAVSVPAPRDPNLIGSAGASLNWRMQLETVRA